MILPWLRIVWVSDEKGYGLVATQAIPKGTITFVKDDLDIVISNCDLLKFAPQIRSHVDKYSYEDFLGNRIISWDHGKYMNHDDNSNTLTTGYDFEIAVRDIEKGEEVTDDYRLFSTHHDPSFLTPPGAPRDIQPWPYELIDHWDASVRSALLNLPQVPQPLGAYVDPRILETVRTFQQNPENYLSVTTSLPLNYRQKAKG